MKVYVCFWEWEWEGCSKPERVFSKLEDAEAWVIETYSPDARFVEMEVE